MKRRKWTALIGGANSSSSPCPLLKPFAVIIVLITAVGTLNVFALVQTMTGGGPYFSSEVMEVYIYRTAFGAANSMTLPRLGYASAAAAFFGVSVMFLATDSDFRCTLGKPRTGRHRCCRNQLGRGMMAVAAKPKRTAREHKRRMEINATRMREIVSTIILTPFALIWVYPFLWMVSAALKDK